MAVSIMDMVLVPLMKESRKSYLIPLRLGIRKSSLIRKYVKAPVRFLTCSFKVRKNGVYKTLATAAKMARGQMVHYIITNRISDFEKLKEFDTDGYFYEPSLSSDSEFVFLQR